ncbi:MAG: sirohydrochlorin cobaltochelatase [Deltaproteobacteria bacterium]|jgi:sirohydrochlorin cobaltochelatase|nr:sirohydrochlorin cobaltochelatase [Deltaproteobacteria bacterium]
MQRKFIVLALAVAAILMFNAPLPAYDRETGKPAIVLAAFGTTEVEALDSFTNILAQVEKAFPDYEVRLAFTSNIIRNIWHKRAQDAAFKKANPKIDQRFYNIGNVFTELAEIQERGADIVLVQSLHVTDGEEFEDVLNLINSLKGIKTFQPSLAPLPWIGVGEPALGTGDGQTAYVTRAAKALGPLAEAAKAQNAALVLMGHGNEHLTQTVFGKLQKSLRDTYGPQIYIGTVEASPKAEDVVAELAKSADKPKKVLLAPMMIVAGDHARNDMAGDEEDSWASLLKAAGFDVESRLAGLGLNNDWVNIYIEHLKSLEPKVKALKK